MAVGEGELLSHTGNKLKDVVALNVKKAKYFAGLFSSSVGLLEFVCYRMDIFWDEVIYVFAFLCTLGKEAEWNLLW